MLALQSAPSGGAAITHCGGGLESQKRKLLRRCEEGIRHSSAKNSKIANNLDYQEWSIQNTALERQMPSPYCVPNAVHFGKPIIQLFATPHWGNRRFSPSVTIASAEPFWQERTSDMLPSLHNARSDGYHKAFGRTTRIAPPAIDKGPLPPAPTPPGAQRPRPAQPSQAAAPASRMPL